MEALCGAGALARVRSLRRDPPHGIQHPVRRVHAVQILGHFRAQESTRHGMRWVTLHLGRTAIFHCDQDSARVRAIVRASGVDNLLHRSSIIRSSALGPGLQRADANRRPNRAEFLGVTSCLLWLKAANLNICHSERPVLARGIRFFPTRTDSRFLATLGMTHLSSNRNQRLGPRQNLADLHRGDSSGLQSLR